MQNISQVSDGELAGIINTWPIIAPSCLKQVFRRQHDLYAEICLRFVHEDEAELYNTDGRSDDYLEVNSEAIAAFNTYIESMQKEHGECIKRLDLTISVRVTKDPLTAPMTVALSVNPCLPKNAPLSDINNKTEPMYGYYAEYSVKKNVSVELPEAYGRPEDHPADKPYTVYDALQNVVLFRLMMQLDQEWNEEKRVGRFLHMAMSKNAFMDKISQPQPKNQVAWIYNPEKGVNRFSPHAEYIALTKRYGPNLKKLPFNQYLMSSVEADQMELMRSYTQNQHIGKRIESISSSWDGEKYTVTFEFRTNHDHNMFASLYMMESTPDDPVPEGVWTVTGVEIKKGSSSWLVPAPDPSAKSFVKKLHKDGEVIAKYIGYPYPANEFMNHLMGNSKRLGQHDSHIVYDKAKGINTFQEVYH